MTYTTTDTYSYTISDIATVVRRFTADLVMIAQSSGAITEEKARDYAHDVELLAKEGYLRMVDLTLFCGSTEVQAVQYVVNTSAGDLEMSRPGGVLWPRVENSDFRIILSYTDTYDATARVATESSLKCKWVPTNADTDHHSLIQSGGRTYASNGWGMQRKDFTS